MSFDIFIFNIIITYDIEFGRSNIKNTNKTK